MDAKEYEKLYLSAQKGVEYIHKVLEGKRHSAKIEIEIPKWVSKKIRGLLGYDINSHKIAASGIQHAKSRHGHNQTGKEKNEIPLTESDFEMIPYILQNPQRIIMGNDTVNGEKSIRYIKQVKDGSIIYVESEEHNDAKEFITRTVWKIKKP